MMRLPIRSLLLAGLACASTAALPQSAAPSRGHLLYTTHCIECHTTQVHWRDEKRARDWDSLKAQVRRWQATAALGWSEADIVEVARHLNETIYNFPQASDRVSRLR